MPYLIATLNLDGLSPLNMGEVSGDTVMVTQGGTLGRSLSTAVTGRGNFQSVIVHGDVYSANGDPAINLEGANAVVAVSGGGMVSTSSLFSISPAIFMPGSGGQVVNAGTITGGTGVTLSPTAGAQSTVYNNGIIQAFGRIDLGPSGIASGVTVDNFSAVAGSFATALIVNTGTISGAGTANQSEPIAIACRDVLTNGGTVAIIVENSGQLAGGVLGEDGADVVRNSGRITHTVSLRENGDSLRNSGTIEGSVFMGNSTDYVRNLGRIENTVSLGADNDVYDGRGGTLLEGVYGDEGNDELTGGLGEDSMFGGAGTDTLRGGGGGDELSGDQGNDVIAGGAGDDIITGGTGFDVMSGGSGADSFVFESAAAIGRLATARDKITDLVSGLDVIDLSQIDANGSAAGNGTFVFIGSGAFTNAAGQLRYTPGSGLLSGDTNGDGTADFILELTNKPAVVALDLIL